VRRLSPTMPFDVDGPRDDPPLSVPGERAYPAAIATPVPPDDPDGVRVSRAGQRLPPSEL